VYTLLLVVQILNSKANKKLNRCAPCVAKCNLCVYFRNPQVQTIRLLTLLHLCVCPNNFSSFKSVGVKPMFVNVIAIAQILIWVWEGEIE
jgi:hypothetical protein